MATIKKGDFIELNYTGKTAEGQLFDTTIKADADTADLQIRKEYKPVIVCAGEGHLLPGLDDQIVGKELGKYTIPLKDVDAFGKKDAKLLQLIPRKVFKEQKLDPAPGLEIDVDNQRGIIRSVSGGRVIVDFNHPLASKDIVYDVEVLRIVTDAAEKIKALLNIAHVPYTEVKVAENKAEITSGFALPPQFIDLFSKDIVRLTSVTDVTFKEEKKESKDKV